ncbi:MAG TPA: DegV family protein [Longilinea sp.]|nr:DegV family protein [Longilinea sp.]
MTIRIVTDSTCDLSPELVAQYGITVIPVFVNIDNKSYQDGVDINKQDFYQKLVQTPGGISTSTPGPEILKGVYKKLFAEGATQILSIHISSTLTNWVNTARLASQDFKESSIHVFDPGQLSLGTGFAVIKAAELIRSGVKMGEIIPQLVEFSQRIFAFTSIDTLEYLRRSGRVSKLEYALGSVLQLKPILHIHSGSLGIERVRTRYASYSRLIEMVKALGPLEQIAVLYTRTRSLGEQLLSMASGLVPDGIQPVFAEATPVLGLHLGPDAVGLVAVKKRS